jgi:5-methylcytosine-specific restriction endonuclease McrA
MKRPCLDCGTPTDGTRCPNCGGAFSKARDQAQSARRKSKGGRPGYNAAFKKMGGEVRATAQTCWVCGLGYRPNDPWQADHIIPLAQGGGAASQLLVGGEGAPLAAAHRSCNIARSNKLRAGKPDPALRRQTSHEGRGAGGARQPPAQHGDDPDAPR